MDNNSCDIPVPEENGGPVTDEPLTRKRVRGHTDSGRFTIGLLLFILVILSACSATKNLPPNEKLYVGGKIKIDDKSTPAKQKKTLESELKGLIVPRPNTSILGFRYEVMFYNIFSSVKRKGGLKYYIKYKLGEAPVLFSSVSVNANNDIIRNRLENRGFLNAYSTADIIEKRRRVKLIYRPVPGYQYLINKVEFSVDSSLVLGSKVKSTESRTFLKPGDAYDLDVIKAERDRIDRRLKETGFYFFGPDDLIIQVDSTIGDHKVDLFLKIKPHTSTKAQQVYTINMIYIYPDYSISQDTIPVTQGVKYNDFVVIDPERKFKPRVFERSIFFHPGDIYNRTDHNLSLNRMVNLGAFKFVKNRFVERGDSTTLDVYYYLTPLPKKSIRAEITGKKNDADFTGAELNLNWRNRNTFRAAELLTFAAYTGADIQAGGNDILSNRNYFKFGVQATLSIPRFVLPFEVNSTSAFVPRTRFTLGYDFLKRQNSYNLNSFRFSAGYLWKENIRKEHELNPVDINFVQPSKITPLYQSLSETDVTLKKAIEDQFTLGATYRFTYTNTAEINKVNTFYYMGGFDLSGNIPGLISGANVKEKEVRTLFGAPFSQYIKIESDFRYYLKVGQHSMLATRIFGGFGYAYGNSLNLPFVKQYFIGGTNSIRAFRARSIGPGTYYAPDDPGATTGFTADQAGDIKLELNLEYRPRIAGIVNGVIFIDAGNIWLLNDDLDPAARKPGSLFSSAFLNELAVGTGIGLRLDFSFLILRTDLAFPLRKPWLPRDERWVVDQINFGSRQWRRDNLIFNLAIGYPF